MVTLNDIKKLLPFWHEDDVLDLIDTWRDRGKDAMVIWNERGQDMIEAMGIADNIEQYDEYRVNVHGCVSCLTNRSRARWDTGEFQETCRNSQAVDNMIFEFLWG